MKRANARHRSQRCVLRTQTDMSGARDQATNCGILPRKWQFTYKMSNPSPLRFRNLRNLHKTPVVNAFGVRQRQEPLRSALCAKDAHRYLDRSAVEVWHQSTVSVCLRELSRLKRRQLIYFCTAKCRKKKPPLHRCADRGTACQGEARFLGMNRLHEM